jgi:hypothetical protein
MSEDNNYSAEPVDPESPNLFELSFRILGNEFIGVKINADNFSGRWLVLTIIFLISLLGMIKLFSPVISEFIDNQTNEPVQIEEQLE